MTQNPVTIAKIEADKLKPTTRSWLLEGIKLRIPLSVIAQKFNVPVVAVRSVLIADRDEIDDSVWEYYKVRL